MATKLYETLGLSKTATVEESMSLLPMFAQVAYTNVRSPQGIQAKGVADAPGQAASGFNSRRQSKC